MKGVKTHFFPLLLKYLRFSHKPQKEKYKFDYFICDHSQSLDNFLNLKKLNLTHFMHIHKKGKI